jgi:hypothetical protein
MWSAAACRRCIPPELAQAGPTTCRTRRPLLPPELPQMMIGVKISPAKPFPPAHTPKKRMCDRAVPGRSAKSANHGKKLRAVGFKFSRKRSTHSLLHLRRCRSVLRPFHRRSQGNPPNDRPLQKSRRGTHIPFAERRPVRITQVANHLMRRHFSPQPAVRGSQGGDACRNRFAIGI